MAAATPPGAGSGEVRPGAVHPGPVVGHPEGGVIDTSGSPFCRVRSVDLDAVRWLPGFWGDRFRQCCEVTLPLLYELMIDPQRGHALTNLRIAAGLEQGEFAGTHWQDEWVYKWLEAASYIYGVTREQRLDQQMDEIIAVIAKAQQPDGYIATQITVRGWPRFQNPQHHELYVMGHLLTAACAHVRATGKESLLNVARKVADYLYRTFMPCPPELAHIQHNPSQIMGLVELYRTTREQRYLDLAAAFVDMHGSRPGGTDLRQDRVPLRQETQVVGHMVFATYLYAGAADVYLETGDRTLLEALERLWRDLTERKLYITGGVCALHRGFSIRNGRFVDDVHEAAGAPYELPNSTAYNETCAQIGSFLWNWRMLASTAEARFADLMELQLYNSILSGIGLDGASWFYTNPLRWYGADHPLLTQDAHQRFQPGLRHICCPSNLLRLIAGLHGYLYRVSERGLWVHLYGASRFDGRLADGTPFALTQRTAYPWEGRVTFTIERAPVQPVAIMLRIPAWAQGATMTVNGTPAGVEAKPGSYAAVERVWSAGDTLQLDLPLRVRLVEGHPRIESVRNQVAVLRGPLVYCLESPDLPPDVHVLEVYLPAGITLQARHDERLLGGITVLEGEAHVVRQGNWTGRLYREFQPRRPERCAIRLIPYYAWANRGVSEMSVWLPLSPYS